MSKSRPTYKVVDLFGNTETRFVETDTREKTLFDDYEGFVEKFKQKKTTDDCYTPKEVYDVVLNYVDERYSLEGKEIIRPFRSEEHTSELQSRGHLVCRLLLEKKKK